MVMSQPKNEQVNDLLFLIADLVQEADSYLCEFGLPAPAKRKDGIEPTKRDLFSRLERRIREKAAPVGRDIFRARRERKARSRYQTLKNVAAPPRKTLGTRLRNR